MAGPYPLCIWIGGTQTRSRNNIGSHPTLIGAAYTRGGCVGLREVNLGKRCFFEFLETDAGRHWNRKRKQSSGAESIPRLHRLSTRRTPEQLTRDFGIAVRHLLGGELQADLAAEFGVDAATISRACRDIPNLLPRLEAADGRMARYLAAFGWLPVLSSWTSSTGRCCLRLGACSVALVAATAAAMRLIPRGDSPWP